MSSDVFAIYQIDNSEKNREYRCRSYEYQIQHGFMITADNYGTGYSGTASRGMGAEAIRKKMQLANFKGVELHETEFYQCDLRKADFRDATGYKVDILGSRLKDAKFSLPEAVNLLADLKIKLS